MGFSDRPYYGQTETRGMGARLRSHSVVAWLLGINVAVFLLDSVLRGSSRGSAFAPYLWGNFNIEQGIHGLQLWRWITYQFIHGDFLHILFNMMGLYFFGPMIESWWGARRFLVFYFLCGSCGALLFTVMANIPGLLEVSAATKLVGASGSVFGILVAGAVLYPHMRVMLLIPPIPMSLRTRALVLLGIGVVSIAMGARNAGGDAAHIGGALLGFLLVKYPGLLDARTWKPPGRNSPKRRQALYEKQARRAEAFEHEVDRILEKVAHQGLQSLSRQEKKTLKSASEKLRS